MSDVWAEILAPAPMFTDGNDESNSFRWPSAFSATLHQR